MVDGLQVEAWLLTAFTYLIVLVEACGGLVIAAGTVRTIWGFVNSFVLHYRPGDMSELRIMLGKSMVIGLEFQVAADILKTGRSPNWNDILLLAATVALRTLLNFLLERELEMLGEGHPFVRDRAASADGA